MADRNVGEEVSMLRMDIANLTQGLMAMTEALSALISMMSDVHKALTPPPSDKEG